MGQVRTFWLALPVRTKGFLVVALPTAGALLLAGLFAVSISRARATSELVVASYGAREAIDDVFLDLTNSETGVRGYALTHDEAYLEPYKLGMDGLYQDLTRLESRVDPDHEQTVHVLNLRTLIAQRVDYFIAVINTARADGSTPKRLLDRAKTTMDRIRVELAAIEQHEADLLDQRLIQRDASDRSAKLLGIAGLVLTLTGGIAAARLFGTGVSRRVQQISDSALRLLEEEPLIAPVEGSDEIALAGQALSDAATMLAQRASELRASQRELQLVVEGLAEGVVMANSEGKFQLFNPAAEEILGLGLVDVDPEEWSSRYHVYLPDGVTLFPAEDLPLTRALHGESTDQVEAISRTPDRGDTWISISGRPIEDEEETIIGGVVVFADVTERKRFELELQRLAVVDELTGLLNRRGFLETAARELALASRLHHEAVVLFMDVDGLKRVNDTLGHDEGSRLLADAAGVLARVARSSDVVGRLGGDEFCVLAIGQARSAMIAVEDRIRDEIRKHNATAERPYELAMSIGAARFDPNDPEDLDELIAQADALMYEQKRQRKGA